LWIIVFSNVEKKVIKFIKLKAMISKQWTVNFSKIFNIKNLLMAYIIDLNFYNKNNILFQVILNNTLICIENFLHLYILHKKNILTIKISFI